MLYSDRYFEHSLKSNIANGSCISAAPGLKKIGRHGIYGSEREKKLQFTALGLDLSILFLIKFSEQN